MEPDGWPFGRYPPRGLVTLGRHVTAFHADGFPIANSAIVRGTDATLVFDANCFRFAAALRTAVEADGPPARELVLSHAHDDHTMGAMHFAPPARVLSTSQARKRLQRNVFEGLVPGAQYAAGYTNAEEEGRAVRVVIPDGDVTGPTEIDLGGGVLVHLRPEGPAHTDGDLWALVEPDGVVLCGDLWYRECEPYVGSGSVVGLLHALESIREAKARVYLPGHGPAGRIGPRGADPVERYCRWVLDQTADGLARGLSGGDLRREIRSRFEARRGVEGGLDIRLTVPGFLEVTVGAALRDLGQAGTLAPT